MSAPICPRCRGYIPSNAQPGLYPGALSRADNVTEVCSECGVEEALVLLAPRDAWPIQTNYVNGVLTAAAFLRDKERITSLSIFEDEPT